MADAPIPFNKPVHLGTEIDALAQAIHVSAHTAGGGPFGRKCEALLDALTNTKTLLVTSCTHALEMQAMLLELGPGDEVIVPSFTFVSTANAVVLRGAKPVFVDCDVDGNLDLTSVEQALTPRTKAISAMHYGGNCCDMDALRTVANGVPVLEDAAQAITSRYKGKPLGTFGAMGAFSFHETKNVGAGEGGALLINDSTFIERAEYVREKGTNRRRFLNGLTDKYTWVDEGSSYVLSDLNAAYLWTQLTHLKRIQERRHHLWNRYAEQLGPLAERHGFHLLKARPGVEGNAHLFALVLRNAEQRSAFIAHMRQKNIMCPFHYVSLHTSPKGASFHDGRTLPNTERLSSCLVRFPLFFNLTDDEQARVLDATAGFFS
jgi:dTDP-4-amino-4,6-dideoxygalactose transaminase